MFLFDLLRGLLTAFVPTSWVAGEAIRGEQRADCCQAERMAWFDYDEDLMMYPIETVKLEFDKTYLISDGVERVKAIYKKAPNPQIQWYEAFIIDAKFINDVVLHEFLCNRMKSIKQECGKWHLVNLQMHGKVEVWFHPTLVAFLLDEDPSSSPTQQPH